MRCGPGATGVACKATSTKTQRVICSYFSKPSDGLEPPTPPYYEREEGVDPSGIARSGAGSKGVEVSAFVAISVAVRPWCDPCTFVGS